MDLVTVDIGGTHARFALASVLPGGAITLGDATAFRTADFPTFVDAWREYARQQGGSGLPGAAAFSIAAPVGSDVIRLVNNPWTIDRRTLGADCGLHSFTIINDFGAVGHAVATLGEEWFCPLAGPDLPLPDGTISVAGPGTGLGVAHVWREGGNYRVQATEGGHFSFAPIDAVDDALLARLRRRYGRVSAERVVSGPGIVDIHAVLAELRGETPPPLGDKEIWRLGIAGEDALAVAAVSHFCGQLGAVAGDLALAQGAGAVVIAGGLGLRLRAFLPQSRFGEMFRAKGRFSEIVGAMPVKLITHPQPGLIGAAAAFAKEYAV